MRRRQEVMERDRAMEGEVVVGVVMMVMMASFLITVSSLLLPPPPFSLLQFKHVSSKPVPSLVVFDKPP